MQENNQQINPGQAEFNQNLINKIAWEAIAEQRRARRWGIFFKLMLIAYVLFLTFMSMPEMWSGTVSGGKHTALVDINGVISAEDEANADNVAVGLRNAFEDSNTAGIILRINSPGGSPVQAGYIYDEIRRLREIHPDIPLYAVISDICASGGYYIAAAADKIFANKASVVGSIGVIMAGFGFVDTMQKVGVERRLFHAGDNKGLLDPFSPLRQDEVDHINHVLDQIHQQFINVVKQGRGDRLQDNDKLYTGLIWTGEESVELGLVDGLGSAGTVARDIIGAEDIIDFTVRENYFSRFAKQIGATFANKLEYNFKLQ